MQYLPSCITIGTKCQCIVTKMGSLVRDDTIGFDRCAFEYALRDSSNRTVPGSSRSCHVRPQRGHRKQQRLLQRRRWNKKQRQRKRAAGITNPQRPITKSKFAKQKKTPVEEPRKGIRKQLALFSWRQREILHGDVPLLLHRFMLPDHC